MWKQIVFLLLFLSNASFSRPLIDILNDLPVGYCEPTYLLNVRRFGVMAKYIYVKHKEWGVERVWAEKLYYDHLRAFNQFSGDNCWFDKVNQKRKKNGFQDYQRGFHALIKSIKVQGFDPSYYLVMGSGAFGNGEHRLGCALAYDLTVPYKYIEDDRVDKVHNYSSYFFKKKGLALKYLDAMALEYAVLKQNSYIVSLFPVARNKDEEVKKILNNYGCIVYEKDVPITKYGPMNLMHLYYGGASWFGTYDNNFAGGRGKAQGCFKHMKQSSLKVFLWECATLDRAKECKNQIRSLFNKGNDAVHINDTHRETVEYAQTFFNKNSIHFLNNAQRKKFKKFDVFFKQYHDFLMQDSVCDECFCIDSSAILSAYGLRDCNDIDFLNHGHKENIKELGAGLGPHDAELKYHAYSKNDIIFNPENFFYFRGCKFASLHVLKKMKSNRNEPKDQKDMYLIERM